MYLFGLIVSHPIPSIIVYPLPTYTIQAWGTILLFIGLRFYQNPSKVEKRSSHAFFASVYSEKTYIENTLTPENSASKNTRQISMLEISVKLDIREKNKLLHIDDIKQYIVPSDTQYFTLTSTTDSLLISIKEEYELSGLSIKDSIVLQPNKGYSPITIDIEYTPFVPLPKNVNPRTNK